MTNYTKNSVFNTKDAYFHSVHRFLYHPVHMCYRSKFEVRCGLAPRNGHSSPSDPEATEPVNSPFRDLERSSVSNFPQNLGSVSPNLGNRVNNTQRLNICRVVNLSQRSFTRRLSPKTRRPKKQRKNFSFFYWYIILNCRKTESFI